MHPIHEFPLHSHDPGLVTLAVLTGFVGAYTSLGLFARVLRSTGTIQAVWFAGTALVAGSGLWTTHFIAMLAFDPGLPMGFDLALTLLSVVVAVAMYAFGFGIAMRGSRTAVVLGCAIGGLGVSIMHWVGVQALIVPARMTVAPGIFAMAAAWGVALSVLAGLTVARGPAVANRLAGAALFALAAAGMHFIGMAALGIEADPLMQAAAVTLPVPWLAGALAAIALAIAGVAAVGATVDDALVRRTRQEAVQLRATVAELEQTKAELSAALAAAATASRAKSQFLAAMSHELRTPLNAIIGFAEMLERQMLGPLGHAQYVSYAGDMLRSGTHLLRLVNDILDYSRIDSGRMDLDETELCVEDLIKHAVRKVDATARESGIAVVTDCAPDLPVLRGDRARLDQILLHLLDNAVRFSTSGGTVYAAATRRPDGLHIDIADSGIGMSAGEVAKALEPFAQVDARLERKYDGLGLGLSLARRLVELHGGRMALRSQPGLGTAVTVVLPASRLVPIEQAA